MERLKKTRLIQLILLLGIMALSYGADYTPMRDVIGFKKVKSVVLKHYNLYALGQDFFGHLGDIFFISDLPVSYDKPQQEKEIIDGGVLIYQDSPLVYADYQGVIIEIGSNYVVLQTSLKTYKFLNLETINVSLYDSVAVGKKIGTCYAIEERFLFYIMEA